MSDSIDDLLAQIQASQDSTAKPKQHSPNSPMPSQPSKGSTGSTTGSIDDLLAEVDDRPSPVRNRLSVPQPQPSSTPVVQPSASPRRDATMDNLLAEMKTTYQEQDRAETLKQQQQLQEEQRQQATLKRQKQAAMIKQAEEWLKTLDPRNGEGAWFEEFAAKYPSRVEAAIEYLGLEG